MPENQARVTLPARPSARSFIRDMQVCAEQAAARLGYSGQYATYHEQPVEADMHVAVNGARLFFDVVGAKLAPEGPAMRERPTLILLTGSPLDHSIFRPVCDALGDVAQVIYLDYRANGHSAHDSALDWPRRQLADDVHGFCAALGIVKPIVLGYSAGARVAMAYACAYPDHPGKLILLSGSVTEDWSASHDAFGRLGGPAARAASVAARELPSPETRAEFVRLCYPYFLKKITPHPDIFARMRTNQAMWEHWAEAPGVREDRANLASILCPTLVLVGEDDPVMPPGQARIIHDALPCQLRRLEVFPGCAHGLHLEDPERFLAAVRSFLVA